MRRRGRFCALLVVAARSRTWVRSLRSSSGKTQNPSAPSQNNHRCLFGGGRGLRVASLPQGGLRVASLPQGGLRVASLPQGEGAGIACRFAPAGGRERERARGLLSRRGWPMSYIAPTPLLKITSRNKGMYINGDFIRLPNKINFSFQAFLEYSAASAS